MLWGGSGSLRMKLACSYNPLFYEGGLSLHDGVELMELGFLAYRSVLSNHDRVGLNECEDLSLSLHVSRSPITENAQNQDVFISEKIRPVRDDARLISVGFHLCDDRRKNIGRFGFSSHYESSKAKEARAIRFIGNVQDSIGKQVWVENANFYSSSPREIVSNWKSFNRIVRQSQARSIIDLSHLVIDCANNDMDPHLLVGLIDWQSVVEIHLSGIVSGRDGMLHDGHSSPVSSKVWRLLENIRELGVLSEEDLYCNIEHSDRRWGDCSEEYLNDFNIIESIFSAETNFPGKQIDATPYAKGYLKTLISEEVENLNQISSHFNLTHDNLLDRWLNHVEQGKYRLSLSRDDMDSEIQKESLYFIDSFIHFINKLQK